jgi:hypothetical protein
VQRPEMSRPVDGDVGARTRARFRYQDEWVALAVLQHLERDGMQGVVVEGLTDLVIYPIEGPGLLVSIKQREPNQRGDVGWTWSALRKQGVLNTSTTPGSPLDGHVQSRSTATQDLEGSARSLSQGRGPDVVNTLASNLAVEAEDAREFLDALALPEDPLPRRKEIRDVALGRVADFLGRNGRTAVAPEVPYEALVLRIESASRDGSDALGPQVTVAPAPGTGAEVDDRFIGADEIVDLLLRAYDRHVTPNLRPPMGTRSDLPRSHRRVGCPRAPPEPGLASRCRPGRTQRDVRDRQDKPGAAIRCSVVADARAGADRRVQPSELGDWACTAWRCPGRGAVNTPRLGGSGPSRDECHVADPRPGFGSRRRAGTGTAAGPMPRDRHDDGEVPR